MKRLNLLPFFITGVGSSLRGEPWEKTSFCNMKEKDTYWSLD
jgi:hypothetical protein